MSRASSFFGVFGFLAFFCVAALAQVEDECAIDFGYQAGGIHSPTFFVRSGYSRDNDDFTEGHYETAVFDFELVGRALPNNAGVCLYLVTTSHLSKEPENAAAWARAWFLRKAGLWQVAEGKLLELEGPSSNATAAKVISQMPSFLGHGKMDQAMIRDTDNRPAPALRTETFLGKFGNGQFYGRAYLQTATGRQNGRPLFTNTDDSDYNVVRHVITWRLNLENGKLADVSRLYSEQLGRDRKEVPTFANQVRLINPTWHGTSVQIGNQTERKFHSAGLLWRDVVVPLENASSPGFGKIDLKEILAGLSAPQPVSDESFERLAKERPPQVPSSTEPVEDDSPREPRFRIRRGRK